MAQAAQRNGCWAVGAISPSRTARSPKGDLIELPRNDISISMTFGLTETDPVTPCPAGTTGTPPNCVPPTETTGAKLASARVKAKKVK